MLWYSLVRNMGRYLYCKCNQPARTQDTLPLGRYLMRPDSENNLFDDRFAVSLLYRFAKFCLSDDLVWTKLLLLILLMKSSLSLMSKLSNYEWVYFRHYMRRKSCMLYGSLDYVLSISRWAKFNSSSYAVFFINLCYYWQSYFCFSMNWENWINKKLDFWCWQYAVWHYEADAICNI